MMNERQITALLAEVGAVMTDDHFVYTSGKHGSAYVNKDAIYPYTSKISALCRAIAEQFRSDEVEVVVGPAVGGVILAQWTAFGLGGLTGRDVMAVYAEKSRDEDEFVITRGYDKLVAGKRTLVVEDILNTGGSARAVAEVVKATGGIVVGIGALCNRGEVTAKDLGVPKLLSLIDVTLENWEAADCPLCQQGRPVNEAVGHGRKFMEALQRNQ